jgi:hypothetical protein
MNKDYETMMREMHSHPIAEYAKPIYQAWDARGIAPPEGHTSWMAFWTHKYGPNGEKDNSGR